MGILCGYLLHYHKKQPFEVPSLIKKCLWVFSSVSIAVVAVLMMICLHTNVTGPPYAFYLITGRLFWCFGFCIMVFLMFNENLMGKKSLINSILSYKLFQFFFKLGYIIYLIHLTVLIWIHGTMRHPWYFSNLSLFQILLSSYVIILTCSALVWLVIEAPFIELARCLWPPPKSVERKTE